jgi:glycosyltransferase involved in cell wall biosynthesis
VTDLLINLSFLIRKPTGITTYAVNIFPHLKFLDPTLLVGEDIPGYSCYLIPSDLTPEQGTRGHFKRLWWTQQQLPKIYKTLRSRLLFSPVPEAPLASNCRSVVMVHDFIPLRFPKRRSPLTYYHRYYIPQVLKQAVHVVCNSEATARDITDFCQISARKITPIALAYDASHFRPLNLPKHNYFLYVGRSDPYKNLSRAIAAFAKLPRELECEFWIAGSPDPRYTPVLQKQVESLNLGDRVKFLNYVGYDRLPILLNQAIALVFPTLWEGFGLPVLEAMACGTAVITSNCSALPEVAADAAILVDPYRVDAIAEALHAVATDVNLRSHLEELALQQASHFSWRKTGERTGEILQKYL